MRRLSLAALALALVTLFSGCYLAEVGECSGAVPRDFYGVCSPRSDFCGDFECLDVGDGRMRCTDTCETDADCPAHPTTPSRCVDSICQEIICEG